MSFGMIVFHLNPLNLYYLYPLFFPNTKAKEEKRPFNWGSWVNPPPVFCQQSKYLITKGPLTLPIGQTFCGNSIETDTLGIGPLKKKILYNFL